MAKHCIHLDLTGRETEGVVRLGCDCCPPVVSEVEMKFQAILFKKLF